MAKRHPNLPTGSGDHYVLENIIRSMTDLCGMEDWRKRILAACANAHRPNDNEFFTGYMSDETLQRWRECSPSQFGKLPDDLSDDEIALLAESLRSFIMSGSRDLGLVEAGCDPKEFNKHGSYYLEDPSSAPPERNAAEQ